jgi:RNA polymerase sigma-70 factor (ECF subfamily)
MMGAEGDDRAERFRAAALGHLDDVYTLARYLLGNAADAEDAAQECFLRAFRHFDSFRGGSAKSWLLAILRNVCRAEYARRVETATTADCNSAHGGQLTPLWESESGAPEAAMLRRLDDAAMRALIAALPEPFREVIVLREINDLSYREIADVTETPVGTVMSRLARGRALLRTAWIAAEGPQK